MNKKTTAVIMSLLAASAFSLTACSTGDAMEADKAMTNESMEKDSMEKDSMEHDAMMSASYTTYKEYSSAMSKYDGNRVVLFFADDAETSSAIDKTFSEDAASIPEGTTVVRVVLEKHMDVADKYSVTSAPTFVELDSNGDAKESWVPESAADLVTGAMSH